MNERTLFIEALEIADPAGRSAYLDAACRGNAQLRSQVAELLTAHEAPGGFMERPAAGPEAGTSVLGPCFTLHTPSRPAVAGYEILEELGRGGMGIVYKARQDRLKRTVALKMLLAGPHAGSGQRARFRIEAEAVARLQHPNIVQIYEVGDSGACPFLALEFVGGGNLKEQTSGTPQPPRLAAQLIETLARAIYYAHERGVVHRDLKPGNILLSDEGQGARDENGAAAKADSSLSFRPTPLDAPKIADFGLAKQFQAEALTAGDLTASGAILGSPCYMAPEQAAGKPGQVGPAADIYALGAILYELLTGRPPFQGETALDTLQQLKSQEPVPPSRLVPKLPRDLETIALKCLEKEPARRYATAAALAEDLRRFQVGEPIASRPVGALERCWRWSRRNPGWAAMLAALAALVLVIVVGAWVGIVHLQKALEASETNLDRAQSAERGTQKQYVDALVEQARANHRGRRSGQRFETLRLAEEASTRGRDLGLAAEHAAALGNIAVAALAMPDLYPALKWPGLPPGSSYVAFDDTLSVYARGDSQGNCVICRLEDRNEVVLHRLPGLGTPAAIYSPRLSGDGRFVAVLCKNGGIQLWKLDGPRPVLWFDAPQTSTSHHLGPFLDFAPDSSRAVLAHVDGRLTYYDLSRRTQISFAANDLTKEVKVAMHPAELLAAVSSYHSPSVQLRDLRTGAVRRVLPHPAGVHSCAWHPGGGTLATAGADGAVRLFDIRSGRLNRTLGPCAGGIRLLFNHAGDRLVAADDWAGAVQIWDVTSGRQLFAMPHGMFAANLRFSRDDRRLAGGYDGNQLLIWHVGDGREFRTLTRALMPVAGTYDRAAVHSDGRLLAVAMQDGVGFWDLVTGEELRFLPTGRVDNLIFEPGPEGGLLLVGLNGVLRCPIRREEGREKRGEGRETRDEGPAIPGKDKRLSHLSPLIRRPSSSLVPHYKIGRPRQLLKIIANDIALSGDGGVMALASRVTFPLPGAWLHHVAKTGGIERIDAGRDVACVSVSPDGRWLATNTHEDPIVKIWDGGTGRLVKQLGRGWGVRFSPDGRWLASSGDLWHVGPTIADWSPGPQVGSNNGQFVFSPDSRLLAMRSPTGHIRLFSPEEARDLARLEVPDPTSNFLAFSPEGTRLIATGSGIHVWDLQRIRMELEARDLAVGHWSLLWGTKIAASTSAQPPPVMTEPSSAILAETWFRSGKALAQLGWRRAAALCCAQALRLAPDHGEALLQRGAEHLRQRHWTEAIADLTRAAEFPALRHTAVFYRSLAYLRLGRHGQAEADRRLLHAAYPHFSESCRQIGTLHTRRGDEALAMVLYQAALHFQPDQAALANQVAWFLVAGPEKLRDPDEALALARRAADLSPKNWMHWNTLGVCCYRAGRWPDAVDALEKSLQLSAGRSGAFDLYFLAMCHAQLGARDKARRFLEQARSWDEQERRRLPQVHVKELRRFRAETEETLRRLRSWDRQGSLEEKR